MSRSFITLRRGRWVGPLAITLTVVLVGCAGGAAATASPTPAPASQPPGASPAIASVEPSPSVVVSVAPSVAPTPSASASPTDSPTPAPSDSPSPAPKAFQFGDSDPLTGLRLSALQVGDWTATTAPKLHFTLTWRTPDTTDSIIRVEGITKCLAPENSNGKPCVTPTSHYTAADFVLIAKRPGSDPVARWAWDAWEEIGEPIATDGPHNFYGIVVTITTGATMRVFVIDASQTCSPGCTY